MIKRDLKKTKVEIKSDFLSKDQRAELEKNLVSKFVKIKGQNNED